MRRKILDEGIRADGRGLTDVRPIWCEVGVLPRTHGSAIFTRGETQALTVTTLGSMSEAIAAKPEPMAKVSVIVRLTLMPMRMEADLSSETQRIARPIFVFCVNW